MSSTDSDLPRVEAILERWFELQLEGAEPDVDELCAEAPHLAPRVREMLDRHDQMLGVGSPRKPQPSHRPLLVDRIGDFELKARIGSGGMGDVYLARETSLDRMVALKVLRPELADDPLRRLRFKREAQLTAALDHPHIVPIHGTGEDDGHVYLVMKLLDGATLDRVREPWTPRRLAAIGGQIARALHAAHEVGIVHRDIKPGNIQLDGDHAYVLDFGLARGRVDLTLTSAGEAPGTLAYMPPEQLRGDGTAIDPRGDVYSLGATLYQCLAGHPPFADHTPEVLVRRALIHDPDPLDLAAADRDLETVILRAMEKDLSRRFPNALELAQDLERFAAGEPIRSRPPSTVTRMIKFARRHRVKSAVLATAAVVSLVFGVQLWRNALHAEREIDRQFGLVTTALREQRPYDAMSRLTELRGNADAVADAEFDDLQWATRSTIARDALLDRIQLDSLYQQTILDDDMLAQMRAAHPSVADQPLTLVARAFLAFNDEDAEGARGCLARLDELDAFPRLRSAFDAELAGRDVATAIAEAAADTTVEDHVFTAVLLHTTGCPRDEVEREIDAAVALDAANPRARLLLGLKRQMHGEFERAEDIFTLLWDENVPRPELHCAIAKLAVANRDLEKAERHVRIAAADVERLGREPILRIAEARVELAIAGGDLEEAERRLAAARAEFGSNEWFDMNEAFILLAREDFEAARAPLRRIHDTARVTWNRRRAAEALLHLDVKQLEAQYETVDAAAITDRHAWHAAVVRKAQPLLDRADALIAEAEGARDGLYTARGNLRRFQVIAVIMDSAAAVELVDVWRSWYPRSWEAITSTLAADELEPEAVCQRALDAVNRLANGEGADANVRTGGLAEAARRRAVELTRAAFRSGETFERQFEVALFAARLSQQLAEPEVALEMGAIADRVLRELGPKRRERVEHLAELLDLVLDELGRSDWPDPATLER